MSNMKTLAIVIEEMKAHNAYTLASVSYADCGTPDSLESSGAKFLVRVRDDAIGRIEDDPDLLGCEDVAAEVADNAPSVYTHALWSEFVDLAAYREDVSDFGYDSIATDEPEKLASISLYSIAERLCNAMLTELRESLTE